MYCAIPGWPPRSFATSSGVVSIPFSPAHWSTSSSDARGSTTWSFRPCITINGGQGPVIPGNDRSTIPRHSSGVRSTGSIIVRIAAKALTSPRKGPPAITAPPLNTAGWATKRFTAMAAPADTPYTNTRPVSTGMVRMAWPTMAMMEAASPSGPCASR